MKRFIQQFIIFALLTASLFTPAFADVDYQIENQPQVIEQTTCLEHKGVLKQKPNGYLYVDVSNEFIASLLPLIEAQGTIVPPSHYKSKKGIGAHISVMYENELIMNDIWEIKELGQEYSFEVLELRTVKIMSSGKAKKLWLLAVSAPELENLRKSYNLSPRLKGHDFHITLGYQLPGKAAAEVFELILEEEVEECEEAA